MLIKGATGNKTFAEPVLCRHVESLGYNGLTKRLTHWGWVMHIWISKQTIIDSDNGLSPGRRQAIIWSNAGILLIRTLGTNFSEILSKIHTFSFKKNHFKMSSAKWRSQCIKKATSSFSDPLPVRYCIHIELLDIIITSCCRSWV